MKTLILTTILTLLFYSGCAQNFGFFNGRLYPSVNKERLNSAKFIMDITPQLWKQLSVPYAEYYELEERRKTQGYYNDNTIVDYVLVEITAINNGKTRSSKSTGDRLTTEQKDILDKADLGSNINITVMYKFKIETAGNTKVRVGKLAVEVVPETEAEFPGTVEKRVSYFSESITNRLSGSSDLDKMSRAIVMFTINEEGLITNAKIVQTSTDAKIDKLLLDAINKMPNWRPAKDAKGKKVKQTFKISMGGGC